MHAYALEILQDAIARGPAAARVLDVGCGSGYLTAVFARLLEQHGKSEQGKVVGIDYIDPLVALSRANMEKADSALLSSGKVELVMGDGWKGNVTNAPFHVIHVGAAATAIPQALVRSRGHFSLCRGRT